MRSSFAWIIWLPYVRYSCGSTISSLIRITYATVHRVHITLRIRTQTNEHKKNTNSTHRIMQIKTVLIHTHTYNPAA